MALTKVKAGNILLTTPAASSNDVTPATTEYVTTALANLADSAPSTLNTLNELAAALGDDANFSTTVTNSIAGKLPLAGGTMTGHILLNNAVELRSKDTSSNIKTITRINSSNELEYGWSGSGPVKFMGGGAYTERMRIHTDGNVGIGTTSPLSKLHVFSSVADNLRLERDSTNDWRFQLTNGALAIRDATADAERMRINDAGDVLIGGTQEYNTLNGRANLVVGSGSGNEGITIVTGTSNTGGITFADGTSGDAAYRGQIEYSHSADAMSFVTAATERMRIDASGNVGIGTTPASASSTTRMHIHNGASTAILQLTGAGVGTTASDGTELAADDNGDFRIRNFESGSMQFFNNGSERMRITSTGNVGIGTSSPGQNLTVSSSGVTYSRVATTASTQAAAHEVVNSTGGGISTISYSNSASGTLFGLNRGGKTFLDSSQDMAIGTSGNAFLSLITNSTERARINSNGTANFGNITAGDRAVGSTPNGALEGFKSGSGTALYLSSGGQTFLHFGSAETGGKDWTFRTAGTGNYGSAAGDLNFVNHTGGYVMTMDYSAGTINGDFNDTSDVALKENIVDINVGLDELKQLQPRNFGWKRDDKTDNTVGFVAQEVETVLSNLVSGEDYDESNPEHGMGKAINTSGLLAVAIKAIQELTDKLEAAEARITTLEG